MTSHNQEETEFEKSYREINERIDKAIDSNKEFKDVFDKTKAEIEEHAKERAKERSGFEHEHEFNKVNDFVTTRWAMPYLERAGSVISGFISRGIGLEELAKKESIAKDVWIRNQADIAAVREERLLTLLEQMSNK